ncbi:hypothetical protein COF68_05445 [Bacillus toyonensis]|uniref:hypothetical protein n=1 Tax=Bacillus toyonensis TaxID=155322 RepID=UPI000BFE036D|nr:hypothetical protein [Bacillus toyonensis]PHE64287.1 hypothetical protein COF68_05445 [Bacillus toyonensis]
MSAIYTLLFKDKEDEVKRVQSFQDIKLEQINQIIGKYFDSHSDIIKVEVYKHRKDKFRLKESVYRKEYQTINNRHLN